MPIRHLAPLIVVALSLTACGGLPLRPATVPADTAPVAAAEAPKLPFEAPGGGMQQLDSDLLYSYLVGEVAAQRGELGLAYRHYLHAAGLAEDGYAAERATRIAVYLGDMKAALQAARLWARFAPNSQDARISLALLLERHGDRAGALAELEALLKISAALGQDGYLQIARVLAKEGASELHDLMAALVAAHAEVADAHYGMAVVAAAGKAYDEAEQQLQQVLTQQPRRVEALVLLARVRHARGDTPAAIHGLTEALQQQPDNRVLRTARARLQVDAGEHEAALKDFRRLRKQSPEDADYVYAVAMLAMHGEHWEEARQAWQQLRDQGGDRYDEATYFLAQVEERDGHLKLAAGLYDSVGDGPLQADAALRQAAIEARQGQLAAARTRLRALREAVPARAVDAYLAEARLLREAGQEAAARQLLDEAVADSPDDIELRYGRAMEAVEAGDLQTMEQDLRHIIALDPQHVDALNALGYSLADRTDRYAEALDYISRAYRLAPENPAIIDSLGWVHYRLGDYAQAIKYLRQALAQIPDAEIAAHLGEVLWVSGDREQARKVWRKALDAAPDSKLLRDVMQRFQ